MLYETWILRSHVGLDETASFSSLFVLTPGDLRSFCQINHFIDQQEEKDSMHPFLDGNNELPMFVYSAYCKTGDKLARTDYHPGIALLVIN
jgi:hypothetical protein